MSPHVFLVAGEESGDRLGAALIAAIKQRTQGRAQFSGVGGAHMAAEGVPSLFPLGDLAIIGFAAIPTRLPKILRRIRETADAVDRRKAGRAGDHRQPGIHPSRGARVCAPARPKFRSSTTSARRSGPGGPGRARAMRAYVDHVLALLPFEPKVIGELGGPPCTYVGHPLTERLGELAAKRT